MPQSFVATVGARRGGYHEVHNYGNPGNYQTYVFAFNDAGLRTLDETGALNDLQEAAPSYDFSSGEVIPEAEEHPALDTFRHAARINTYCVLSMNLSIEDYPARWFGADHDEVRTLP